MSSHPATRRPHNGATKGEGTGKGLRDFFSQNYLSHTHTHTLSRQSGRWAWTFVITIGLGKAGREWWGGGQQLPTQTGQTGSPSRLPPLQPPPSPSPLLTARKTRTNDFLIHLHVWKCVFAVYVCVCKHPKGVKVLPQAHIVARVN